MTISNRYERYRSKVIGLIPAGGQATRIAPLPCSKELYPIGFRQVDEDGGLRPKVVCHYLLEKMRLAGITKTYFILRDGKWDIPSYFVGGEILNMDLAYLVTHPTSGVPYTIDQAYPFVKDAIVALGFPDIVFQPDEAFEKLLERQAETNADIVLGIFNVENPQKWDMVDFDKEGRIRRIIIKPRQTHMRYSWAIAVWTPVFTDFMHNYLSTIQKAREQDNARKSVPDQQELFVGDVIQAAIDNNMHVEGVIFPDSMCLDIGTPGDLVKAVRSEITATVSK